MPQQNPIDISPIGIMFAVTAFDQSDDPLSMIGHDTLLLLVGRNAPRYGVPH